MDKNCNWRGFLRTKGTRAALAQIVEKYGYYILILLAILALLYMFVKLVFFFAEPHS